MDEQRSDRDDPFPSSDVVPESPVSIGSATAALAQVESLLQQRRLPEAERLLRQELIQQGPVPAVVTLLARTLLAQGKARDARDFINHCCNVMVPAPATLLLLRAQILLDMGERKDAIAAFQYAVAAAPDQGAAHIGLAMALGQDGQSRAAHASARLAIANGIDHAGSHSLLARSCYELHRYDEAEAEYRLALKHDPWSPRTHASLAEIVWLRTRDIHAALADIHHALSQLHGSRATNLQTVRTRLLSATGHYQDAAEQLEPLIASKPEDLSLRILAIKTFLAVDASKAVHHGAHARQLAPGHTGVIGLCGDAMLASGRPDAASDIAQRLLAGNPDDNHAIALQTASWRALGDPRHLPFHDYASLVQTCMLDVPRGWPSLRHYLDDLAGELHREHTLLAEPLDQSVRGGTQIELRCTETDLPAIRAFPEAIHGPIRHYISGLRAGDTPWHQRATGHYRLNGLWSARLRSRGHHVSHYHGQGWVSSACYVQLPEAVDHGHGEGWLKFGEPHVAAHPALDADYYLRPEPGLLVLFPSWMWHGTVPFTGTADEHRLGMAFDVVPATVR